ncbi:MAG TPA: phosphate/phosphite/phosphonate ABC transporter substrate-binding protein [Bryobacteraceae bacterium]|nr:phosphate/phosphite/phosphonate ABC transporter substrate-binding protein [Bryobacteraceae bacterium]
MPYLQRWVLLLIACAGSASARSAPEGTFEPGTAETAGAGVQLPEYRFGVEPISSTRALWRRYRPFTSAVNAAVSGFSIRLESALQAPGYERKLRAGEFDLVVVEPHRVLEIERLNYRVFARAGREDGIEGVIVVRADAQLERPAELNGKVVCFGPPNALASTLLPRMWLREAGFSERKSQISFTGSEDTALFSVWRGLADAAAVSRTAWEHFLSDHVQASMLKAKWRTARLSGAAVMTHGRVPAEHIRQLEAAFTHLDETEPGRRALRGLGLKSLRAADASAYDDVWEFLTSYARLFGYQAPGVGR